MFNTNHKSILDLITEDTYIISDTHFGHDNIAQFEPSRLVHMASSGYTTHDEWLISQWNSVVKEDDVILHLGDFAFKNIQDVQHKLNGRKILILGNHDRKGYQTYNAFEYVVRGLWVQHENHYLQGHTTDELASVLIKTINGQRVMFSHYPVCESELRYNEKRPQISNRLLALKDLYYSYACTVNVHGHTHSNNMIDKDVRVFKNVSMENIGMRPIKIKDIIK